MSARRWRLPLLVRVTLGLVLLGALPLVVVLTNVVSVSRTLERQAERLQISHARLTAERIANFVAAFDTLLTTTAAAPALGQDPMGPEATGALATLLDTHPEVAGAQLLDSGGVQLARIQDKSYAEDVDEALDQVPVETGAVPGVRLVAGRRSLWLVGTTRVDTGAEDVQLRLVAQGGELADIFRPEEIGRHAEVVLADLDRRVLAGSAPSLDAFPEALVAQASSGSLSGAGPFDGEEKLLGAYYPVPGMPWVVISTQPVDQAERAARDLRRRSLLAMGTALLLVGFLSAVAYGSVVKPIRKMVHEQRRLAGLSASRSGGNEIDQLRESFEALRQRLGELSRTGSARAATEEDLGQLFLGRYRVLSVLGEGGMGMVFRAWDPTLQRKVALKTLRLGTFDAPEARRRQAETLLHEAVAAARIQHPNVVAVFDVVHQDDMGFLTMELVEGITLDQLLRRRGWLYPGETAHVGIAVGRALAAAHAQGLVHQDVKPGNILLGEGGAIKVVDFGIARFLSTLAPSEGKIFGTPGYLSPEALLGRGYSEAGDLFALGVILYQCLAGRRPFWGRTPRQAMIATLAGRPELLVEIREGVPGELANLVHDLLDPEPEVRVSTFRRLETVLGSLADNEAQLHWTESEQGDLPERSAGATDETRSGFFSHLAEGSSEARALVEEMERNR